MVIRQSASDKNPALRRTRNPAKTCSTLNPDTFLPESLDKKSEHDYQVLALSYSARGGLQRQAIRKSRCKYVYWWQFLFIEKGEHSLWSGNFIRTSERFSPPGTSAQLAELIALTTALELGTNKRVNIYTDSKCAYLFLHAHAAIWKKRTLKTSDGSPIKYYQANYVPPRCKVTQGWWHNILLRSSDGWFWKNSRGK